MQRELGITFVHVTHSQLEAIALADLVVVMEKGEIRQAGRRATSMRQPERSICRRVPRRPERASAAGSRRSTAACRDVRAAGLHGIACRSAPARMSAPAIRLTSRCAATTSIWCGPAPMRAA